MEYYQRTEWATGDVVDAEKLNNLESGVAVSYPLVISAHIQHSGNTTTTVTELTSELFQQVGMMLTYGMRADIIVADNSNGVIYFETIVQLSQSDVTFITLGVDSGGLPKGKTYSLNEQSGYYECVETSSSAS